MNFKTFLKFINSDKLVQHLGDLLRSLRSRLEKLRNMAAAYSLDELKLWKAYVLCSYCTARGLSASNKRKMN